MDIHKLISGNREGGVGIPDDLRCKRSDGKQWRCTAMSMPDKTVCEKHYVQAKKRAVSSAQRASTNKGKRKTTVDGDGYEDGRNGEMDMDVANKDETPEEYAVSVAKKKSKEKIPRREFSDSPESSAERSLRASGREDGGVEFLNAGDNQMPLYGNLPNATMDGYGNKYESNSDSDELEVSTEGSTDSSDESDEQPCHQCQRNERVLWCLRCDRRGYCASCIARSYSDIPVDEIQRACPACRGSCVCGVCRHMERLVKERIRSLPAQDKLEYFYTLLSSVLPIVKKIHNQQISEVELEKKLCGTDVELPRAKLSADEQICCNFCKTPIIDYYRDCENCSYDLCLNCCNDLREVSVGRGRDKGNVTEQTRPPTQTNIFVGRVHKWKANSNGSIPCPPRENGGCGCPSLILSRIFKMNWVAKLVKNAEEMVSGCKVQDDNILVSADASNSRFFQAANRDDDDGDNFLYSPTFYITKIEGISTFRKYWLKGQPIIIQEVCDKTPISNWDPVVIRRGFMEIANEKMIQESRTVKAINCWDWTEVDVELSQFLRGYSEGIIADNGKPQILKLKDWPAPSISEELLSYQTPDFISRLPFLEYFHSKWGLLSVASKLPQYSIQNDVGPKVLISYGAYEELGEGDSVSKLHISMSDQVYILVHSHEVKLKGSSMMKDLKTLEDSNFHIPEDYDEAAKTTLNSKCPAAESHGEQQAGHEVDTKVENIKDTTMGEQEITSCHGNGDNNKNLELPNTNNRDLAGARWDIFRRQDVPKLIEFLSVHFKDAEAPDYENPLFGDVVYLNKHHIRLLKETFGVEPWSFEQQMGQAVFVPAGCPFQLRNLQSTVQLALDFLSPESLGVSTKIAEEIRCLRDNHDAKVKILEVGKMSLYAASSAIKEVQKLVLDPKYSAEIGPEDPNLTKMVSENLEKMIRHRHQIECS